MFPSPRESQVFRHDHVALAVKDLEVSREFYEFLGGRVVSKPSSAFMEIVLGEIRLHLIPNADGAGGDHERPRIDHLCLRVASVEDLLSVQKMISPRSPCEVEDSPPLGEGGKEHVEECPPRKTLYFEDPDGIRLEIRAYA
jgi:catechol 2,3-dioxygenase-like lactoylglutathione lyase family enzyme